MQIEFHAVQAGAPEEVLSLGSEEAAEALCPVSTRKGSAYCQDALYPLRNLASTDAPSTHAAPFVSHCSSERPHSTAAHVIKTRCIPS